MTERQTPSGPPPGFDEQLHAWHKAVAGVFARVDRKDVADVPLDSWKRLITTTYDGIDVNPLYTRADELPETAEPGAFPYTRAADLKPLETAGWGVRETFTATGSNSAVLGALTNGTTDLRFDLRGGVDASDLQAALTGVIPELAPLIIDAGAQTTAAAEVLFAVADTASDPEAVRLELGAAPLTGFDRGTEVCLDEAVALAKIAAQRPGDVRALLVDGVAFGNLGAGDAQEIGYSLAVAVEYLRALTDSGLSVDEAVNQIAFRLSATDDQFATIAKFRAARQLWARVVEVSGGSTAKDTPFNAVTAPAMFSRRDPWVNMLRSTVAAFGAGVGGATSVEISPFDAAVVGGQPGVSRAFAARIARNTNLLLLEESHLGMVADPAGGSFYVEKFTDELSDVAWSIFTSLESDGGFSAGRDSVFAAIDETYEARRSDIAHRRTSITAINEFPNLAEAPLPVEARPHDESVRRWAADFEELRDRSDDFLAANGSRPQIALIPLGPLAKHNVRTGFATNLLASGGIEALNPGQVTPGTDEFAEAVSTSVVVLCGADAEYAASGEDAVRAAREAGATEVLVAGSPRPFADATDAPDGHLTMTINAVEELSRLLDTLGA